MTRRFHFLRYWTWFLTHRPRTAFPVFIRWARVTRLGRDWQRWAECSHAHDGETT